MDISEWDDAQLDATRTIFLSSTGNISPQPISIPGIPKAVAHSPFMENITIVRQLVLKSGYPREDDPFKYPILNDVDERTYGDPDDQGQSIYHFAVLRSTTDGVPRAVELSNSNWLAEGQTIMWRNTSTLISSEYFGSLEFQICRVHVPSQIGIITANISTIYEPVIPYSTSFCWDRLGYQKAKITVAPWNTKEAYRNMKATRVVKDTAWIAFRPFVAITSGTEIGILMSGAHEALGLNYCHSCATASDRTRLHARKDRF